VKRQAARRPRRYSITRVLAKELAPRKIRVDSIAPGYTETEGVHRIGLIVHSSDFER
jgi:3-oxoacyl-[acyl-carrier protein] reductase